MKMLNYREDCKDKICVGCAYYRIPRFCHVLNRPVSPIGHCDGYISCNLYERLGDIEIVIKEGEFKNYRFDGRDYPNLNLAARAEVSKRLQNPIDFSEDEALITEGNKIIIHGQVLPLSEYEAIADEPND